ncbi:MAG: Re/Si-specific NAD(P)(+) transhydrogenase subunit alpha [Oceanospirillaceae bacterium]|nr:Re/Si-specific NAD(P)(+) transhydrogenase subunit alpha [Oceanospirillaceae bacterium]
MKIGIPKEIEEGELRVAITPSVASRVKQLGFDIMIESGAGAAASYSDEAYKEAGVEVTLDTKQLWHEADILVKVRPPVEHPELGFYGIELLGNNQTLISLIHPAQNATKLQQLSERGTNVIALDAVPRISRAQKMDVLSSMANIAGYRAVVEAAQHFGRFFTGQITAAGKVPPAKVLVIGAGVAGLAAIGAAKSMGAIVRAFDTRPEVKEQVESMNAEFLLLDFSDEDGNGEGGYAKTMSAEFITAEMTLFAEQAKEVDIIITTALIPGKTAPELITEEMVRSMKAGSVIVDLAAETGGNCRLTEANKVVNVHGVSIIGYTNLPSRMAAQSSQLFATNILHLLTELCPEKNGEIFLNMKDEVIRGATVVKDGSITWPPPAPRLSAAPKTDVSEPLSTEKTHATVKEKKSSTFGFLIPVFITGIILLGLGSVAPAEFMGHLTVFVLSCFVGYMVVWGVSHSLHTPLMSVTNAISSIIVIGAITQVSSQSPTVSILAALAIFITSINIVGGFAVTHRMLKMFRK